MTLKNVVLPAPLGPIRAVIEPSSTSQVAPSTARMPANRLTTPSARKMHPLAPPSFTEHHLLALAEDALGPEGHDQDERHAEDGEAKRGDADVGEGRVRQIEVERGLEDRPEDPGADEDAPVAGEAAEDEHPVRVERDQRLV